MPTREDGAKEIIYCDGKAVGEVREVGLPKIEREQEDKVSQVRQAFINTKIIVCLCRLHKMRSKHPGVKIKDCYKGFKHYRANRQRCSRRYGKHVKGK